MVAQINYRKMAFAHYAPICAYCGLGVPEILEVAHLDGNLRVRAALAPACFMRSLVHLLLPIAHVDHGRRRALVRPPEPRVRLVHSSA
jgi:hypothetical protein